MSNNTYNYLLSDLKKLKGVGTKTYNLLKKKKINNIFDLLWRLPKSYTDRSKSTKIKDLKIGEVQTITLIPYKYNFPRVRNLPNRVVCTDETGEIDCVFFNSYEGYIKKILPIGKEIIVSGKINYFRKKYQIINPTYVSNDMNSIKKVFSTYSLTEGLTEKKYLKIINNVLKRISIPIVNTATAKTGSPTIGRRNVLSTIELNIPVNKIARNSEGKKGKPLSTAKALINPAPTTAKAGCAKLNTSIDL